MRVGREEGNRHSARYEPDDCVANWLDHLVTYPSSEGVLYLLRHLEDWEARDGVTAPREVAGIALFNAQLKYPSGSPEDPSERTSATALGKRGYRLRAPIRCSAGPSSLGRRRLFVAGGATLRVF